MNSTGCDQKSREQYDKIPVLVDITGDGLHAEDSRNMSNNCNTNE